MKLENVLAVKGSKIEICAPGDTIAEVVAHLRSANVGALVVVEGGKPAGIISERDIARAIDSRSELLTLPADALMTRNVVCGAPGDDVATVLDTMTARHFRHLPVVLGGEIVGLVTTGDLIRAELETLRGAVVSLEDQVMSEGSE